MPISSAVVGRSDSARSCVPTLVRTSTQADGERPPRSTATPSRSVSQLITTPATSNAAPAMIGANGCGLLPNRMNDREMRIRSGPTVIADRVVVSDSASQVAAIQPDDRRQQPADHHADQRSEPDRHVGGGHEPDGDRTRRTSRSRPGRSSPPAPAAPSESGTRRAPRRRRQRRAPRGLLESCPVLPIAVRGRPGRWPGLPRISPAGSAASRRRPSPRRSCPS